MQGTLDQTTCIIANKNDAAIHFNCGSFYLLPSLLWRYAKIVFKLLLIILYIISQYGLFLRLFTKNGISLESILPDPIETTKDSEVSFYVHSTTTRDSKTCFWNMPDYSGQKCTLAIDMDDGNWKTIEDGNNCDEFLEGR